MDLWIFSLILLLCGSQACDNCQILTDCFGVGMLARALDTFYGELLTKLNKQAKKFESSCERSTENWDQFHLAFQFLRISGSIVYSNNG